MDTQTKPVVIGFDGTPDAEAALAWAVDHARTVGLALRVVVARGDLHMMSSWADRWTRGLADEWCDQASKALAGLGEYPRTDVVVCDGMPSDVLIRESEDAALVVVGSQGHSVLVGVFQGSVSQHVSRNASSPVAVVRRREDMSATRIVVGVDGSGASIDALEFALGLARLRCCSVSVVYCPQRWQGFDDERPPELAPDLLAEFELREREVRGQIAEAGHRAGAGVGLLEVSLEEVSRVRHPSRELIEASRSSALVVVGARGRGGFAGLVLGSVSADVVRHAHCSVVVVR